MRLAPRFMYYFVFAWRSDFVRDKRSRRVRASPKFQPLWIGLTLEVILDEANVNYRAKEPANRCVSRVSLVLNINQRVHLAEV